MAESIVTVIFANKNRTRPTLRVTIPQACADFLKLQKGDKLFVFTENGRLVYQKVKGRKS